MIRFLPVIAASEEILELSDKIEDDNPVKVQRARLQVDSRKWLAARMAPKKYGDRISHDVKGPGPTIQPAILVRSTVGQSMSGLYFNLYPKRAMAFLSRATEILHG